jgi:hypothetical protein
MGSDQRDRLIVNLYYPLLSDYLKGQMMRAELLAIGNQIKAKWVARVAKDTGNLASTAAVTMRKGGAKRDRWEVEFSAGGPRAEYAPEIEDEGHALEDTLREMRL